MALELDPECILVAFELVFRCARIVLNHEKPTSLSLSLCLWLLQTFAEEDTEEVNERGAEMLNSQDERQFRKLQLALFLLQFSWLNDS